MATFEAKDPWCTLPSRKLLSMSDIDYHEQNPPLKSWLPQPQNGTKWPPRLQQSSSK